MSAQVDPFDLNDEQIETRLGVAPTDDPRTSMLTKHLKENWAALQTDALKGLVERANRPGTMARQAFAEYLQRAGPMTSEDWAKEMQARGDGIYQLALAAELQFQVFGNRE